jgi:hypothetical protein
LRLGIHFWFVHEREKRALDWGDLRWEVEVCSLSILWSHLEAVLKHTVQDSRDTE